MKNQYYPPDGLKTNKPKEGEIHVESFVFNIDKNYNKPLNEVSKEIQRRKNIIKVPCFRDSW